MPLRRLSRYVSALCSRILLVVANSVAAPLAPLAEAALGPVAAADDVFDVVVRDRTDQLGGAVGRIIVDEDDLPVDRGKRDTRPRQEDRDVVPFAQLGKDGAEFGHPGAFRTRLSPGARTGCPEAR